MPRVSWQLLHGRPGVEVILRLATGRGQLTRQLLADSGAGTMNAPFHLILRQSDCLACGAKPSRLVVLSRAYTGAHPVYTLRVEIPALGFRQAVWAVGVPSPPSGFDGIACFPFLNQFTYGNFGDATKFGLEC